ncbi:hypothetical protein RS82_02915 [Microbacterium trichothecenolyticum]|uniref:Uncharacterized protein n=1 Tax=Microbacterium trichothecenolyticum TaxID=69370 RepID=A0A0M2H5C3_MICTR|nr:hypothetical protein RS82_02915 [Microbacterium trichothecenolyticum]
MANDASSRSHPVAPHGSAAGYAAGCRTKGGCPSNDTTDYLTCVEAATARRSNYALSRLPQYQVIPRNFGSEGQLPSDLELDASVHGTRWGYRRGCNQDENCPNWRSGKVTCAEARCRYVAKYNAGRRDGSGTPLEHGTSNGYLLGCRDPRGCPGGEDGTSCRSARAAYRADRARRIGISPAEFIDSAAATTRVRNWLAEGHSLRVIARATGCGSTTISDLSDPQRSGRLRVSASTMRKIMSADLPKQA